MSHWIDVENFSESFYEDLLDDMRSEGKTFSDKELLYKLISSLWAQSYNGDMIKVPTTGVGDLSDGYHTFNELYRHRAILFAVVCSQFPALAWKSKNHHDPDDKMYDGMFIVGIETPAGQATYHYDMDPYWDCFHVKELDRAPKYDGHTPDEAIERINTLKFFSKFEGMDQAYSIRGSTSEELACDLLEISESGRLFTDEAETLRNAAFLLMKMNDDIYHYKRIGDER